jgi:hypothetical protein
MDPRHIWNRIYLSKQVFQRRDSAGAFSFSTHEDMRIVIGASTRDAEIRHRDFLKAEWKGFHLSFIDNQCIVNASIWPASGL